MSYKIKINYTYPTLIQNQFNVLMQDKYDLIQWFSDFLEQNPHLKDKIKNFEVIEQYVDWVWGFYHWIWMLVDFIY